MPAPKHPIFTRLKPKLARADHQIRRMIEYRELVARMPQEFRSEWATATTLSTAVARVYGLFEAVMKGIARDIDGNAPFGENADRDLLDQMHADLGYRRPALLSEDLYSSLIDLLEFRDEVRALRSEDIGQLRVEKSVGRLLEIYLDFVDSVEALEATMMRPRSL